ncbi:hypothetical protein IR012_09955 [Pseudomonas putida]|uniref:hypothetical protein n=1 Tax=Pseudomonas putida TaxID=303 RepID=UPI0018AAE79A|nr:hypothetical protein [Pseudomonas putida]MBF8669907.1 hypothetical protein [Pseudomonas putida]MBF8712635.1 hypothetical protein [Pseudomonas putida]
MNKRIDLTITHDYLNPFASPDNPKLSPELVDYLSDSAWYHPELSLHVRCPEDERERLQQAISNTFTEKMEQLKGDIRIQRLVALTLLSLALALVLAGTALGIEGTIPVGVVTVTAWMLLWRSAEIVFLDIRSINRQQRKYQRIANAPMQFCA